MVLRSMQKHGKNPPKEIYEKKKILDDKKGLLNFVINGHGVKFS